MAELKSEYEKEGKVYFDCEYGIQISTCDIDLTLIADTEDMFDFAKKVKKALIENLEDWKRTMEFAYNDYVKQGRDSPYHKERIIFYTNEIERAKAL